MNRTSRYALWVFLTGLVYASCSDVPVGLEDSRVFPSSKSAELAASIIQVHGAGQTGIGLPLAGQGVQTFDMDVRSDLSGYLDYTDYSVVRSDGSVATLAVDAMDPGTGVTLFRDTSAVCDDPTVGVEYEGTGRLDTEELVEFSVIACDYADPGATIDDLFWIQVPSHSYSVKDRLSDGDLSKDTLQSDSNEPPGFTRIAEHQLNCIPNAVGCDAMDGGWYNDASSNFSIVTGMDRNGATADIVQMRFPTGMPDGGEPARFDGWGPDIGEGGDFPYDQLYASLWLKVEGPDYQNQSVGTKIFYVAYGSVERKNHSTFMLRGNGTQSIVTEMPLEYAISEMNLDGTDPGGGAVFHPTNINDVRFTVGAWHHIELWMKINDINPTVANGEIKWWLDGTLLAHHTGKRYRSDLNPKGFYHLQVTPVYGGNSGDIRTRDDSWLFDHIYMSALVP